jgi:hypothetical protein
MALLLLGAALAGAATRRDGRECRMPGMHDCCRKAHSSGRTPEAAAARLCCLVNCPRPAPTGTNFTFRSSSEAAPMPRPPAAQTPGLPAAARARAYAPPFQPSHSPPAYIQHLALLI